MNEVNDYIEKLIKGKDDVQVFLMNGVKLKGVIVKQNEHCFILDGQDGDQIVNTQNLMTIQPAEKGYKF